ncbi:Serine-rich adhesin for platelets [Lasiodiplodia hormozganensis]|uniref:Serine-rich adhesin for platelets n=1 Tax=Lasiodiplodia hormozganensis TaxID=869390 RepID=A0AA39Z3S2_9PEZI|nr:Serine-rich adhesin for platelets [Lasiodiplodia hormozganensis]
MHPTRLLLSTGVLACAGTALAQLNFETDATLHDYPSLADGRGKYNPPWCEVGYDSLDLNSITSYCAIDKSTCGACLNVCGSKGCKYLLAIDQCSRSDGLLDMSTGAGQEVGGATTGHLQVKVTQVDASKCEHIWNGQMYFSWAAPYGGLATLKSMIDSEPKTANRVVDYTTSSQSSLTLVSSTSSAKASSIESPSTKALSTEVSSTVAKPVSESSVTTETKAASESSSFTETKASRLGAAHAQPQFTSKYSSPTETKVSSVDSAPAKPAVTSEYSSPAETESPSTYAIPANTASSPSVENSPSSSAPKQSEIVPAFTSPTPATTASSSPAEDSPSYTVPQQSKTVNPDAAMTSEPRSVPTTTSFSSSAPFSDSSVIVAASLSAPGSIPTNDDSDTKTDLGPDPNGAGGRIMIGNQESGSRTVTSLDGESEECVTITSTVPGSVIHYTVTIGRGSQKTINQSPSSTTQGVFAENAASDSTRKATTLVRSTSTIWYTQTTISTGCLSGGTECPESLRTTCTSTMLSAVRTYMAVPVYATPSQGDPDNINGMHAVEPPNAEVSAGAHAAGVKERSEISAPAPHAKRSAAPAPAGSHTWEAIMALSGLIALAVLAL